MYNVIPLHMHDVIEANIPDIFLIFSSLVELLIPDAIHEHRQQSNINTPAIFLAGDEGGGG
jgi:hypothetical protein